MVLVTKSHPQSNSHSSQASPSTSTSTSSNPKRRSLFGGLARRRQSSDNYDSDSNPDSKSRNNNTSSSVSSPPPLPTSPPPTKTQFNTNQYSQPTTKNTSQWPGGPQSLDDWVNRSAETKDADQALSSSQGRNIVVGQNGNGNPSGQHHSHSVGHATSTSNDFQLNSNQDGSPPIFGTEEWDSMQYVLDRVEDGSMINSSDSPPNPQDHSKFNQNQSSSSNDSSQEQSFPLGRVSLDLLVHDPSETRPFAGVQPRPRQDSAPQLVHSRHRSHFSIPDVVVTAAEEEGQGQHFEVKVPAAKRRSFVLNVHNPQIHSMPTNNNNNNNNGGTATGFPSKKNKGANKLKPLIRLDSPVVSTGSPNAFVINSSNSVGEEMNSNGTGSNNSSANSTLSKGSGTTNTSSSSSVGTSSSNTTVPSNRKGKKTFSLFGKKSSPSTSPNPAQPTSPTTSNPIGKPFYSSPHDSSGSLPTSSSASGAESSKESLTMKSSSKEANQANTSPPTSTSSDGESIGGGGGFSGLPRSVPNFNIPSNGVPAPTSNLIKGNASPSIGSFQTSSPQPSSINSFSPQSSAPNSPNPNGTWNNNNATISSPPKKLTKKEQKMREKQELDLIKQVEKIDKMVRQHDEKERKREKKEREKMKKNANNTLDSLQQNDVVVENVVKVPKPQSKMRRLTIFSAKSKAGPAAANQQAQMAALERRNSARRVNPRPPSSKGIATNSVVNENHQPQLHQQGREPDSSNFSFPPRPPPPSSQQQQQQPPNSGSPPSTLNRSRPPRTRPPQLPQEEGFSSSQPQGQSQQRNGPAPPTIVLTSPSSPVRTSFSESYPQPSNLPSHEEDMTSKPIPVLAGIGETVKRASQEWQDLTSPTRTEFPSMSASEVNGSENGSPNQSISSSTGLSRSTSLQRALAYTHAEEGMIRKKANLKRRGSKRSISGGGSGSTRSSIVDSDGTSTPQRRPSFLRKGSGNVKQVEDGEWEEEEEEEEEEKSISSKNQNQGTSPGSITPKAGNVTPQGRISPSSTSPNQINHVTTTTNNNPPPVLPAVSFSRPFSRPPPPPLQSSPSPSSPTKIKTEPFIDAMAHIISAASPPLEAAKVRSNPIYYDNEKNRNGSVSSNSTGGSSGSSRTGDGSPKKYRNLPGGGRKDDHFVFPIVRTVRSSTLDNPPTKPNDGQNSKEYGTSPLPRSSSTPQYF